MTSTDSQILNLISDIRSEVIEAEELEERIDLARKQLESDEDDLAAVKASISSNREKLDELIDEATGQNEEDSVPEYRGYMG